jgi:GMP synthase-like glutamine amidotransferase
MKPVRIFRHIACEGPGYLGTLLDKKHIPYEIIRIDENQPVPQSLEDISGLVFMGGSMSVNDSLDWIADEVKLIQAAREKDMPMLGVCLGSQLIAKALGVTVGKGTGQEIGWANVHKVQPQQADGWFDGLDDQFIAFHWHGDTFPIPPGANHLLSSDCYANQAFSIGNTLALQFHLEMTADMVREWVSLYQDDVHCGHHCVQAEKSLLAETDASTSELNVVADVVLNNWISRLSA